MKKEVVFTKDESYLLEENPYELLQDEDDETEESLTIPTKSNINILKATQEIDKIIGEFAKKLARIAKKYPKVGIGDTGTDEAISNELYSTIH